MLSGITPASTPIPVLKARSRSVERGFGQSWLFHRELSTVVAQHARAWVHNNGDLGQPAEDRLRPDPAPSLPPSRPRQAVIDACSREFTRHTGRFCFSGIPRYP